MGFFKKLFGSTKKSGEYVDTRGVYFYVRCNHCGTITRVRADKEYDLERDGNSFSWHKTIVDNRCFRPIAAVVYLDGNYQVSSEEISGGVFVSEAEYKTSLEPDVGSVTDQEIGDG